MDTSHYNGAIEIRGISQTYDNGYLFTGYGGEQNNIVFKCDSGLNLPLSEGWYKINTVNAQPKLNFYPNPVSDLLYIESQGNETIKEIKIYDIYGRIILTKKTSESQIIIDVSGIENGLYILETDNVYSGKIVIQN